MLVSMVLLDHQENWLAFLDYELIDIKETQEAGVIRHLEVTYTIPDAEKAKKLFAPGHFLWVSGYGGSTDCLYVINDTVKIDYYKKNSVTFEAEDCIAELNYVPPFTQTNIVSGRGLDIVTRNGQPAVKVNRRFLEYMFGDYFNIGIVQTCLNDYVSRISPTGTMNKMELLRFIEDETSNVFRTRYEKDPNSNTIYRYLDFLNPDDAHKQWVLGFNYDVPEEEDESDEVDNEDENEPIIDDIILPTYTPDTPLDVENTLFRLVNINGEVLTAKDSNDETVPISFVPDEVGVTNDDDSYEIYLNYRPVTENEVTTQRLNITVNQKTINYDLADDETEPESMDMGTDNYSSVAVEQPDLYCTLPNYCRFEIRYHNPNDGEDHTNDKLLYYQEVNPILCDVHEDVIDLTYSAENITYEINETDSYNSIAPLLEVKKSNDGLTRAQMNTLLTNWKNLSISKGATIPMILQRIQVASGTSMGTYNVSSNYYVTPIKKSQVSDGQVEYIQGTAYWNAPFRKAKGEMFIRDDEVTGIVYNNVRGRIEDTRGISFPKIGNVETTAEDIYEIYNVCANKLKEKRYPQLELKVDVARYKNGQMNYYNLYDKVYIKVPGYSKLVTATVCKTVKNPKDMGDNTVELTNYSVNTTVPQTDTELLADNVTVKYPNKKNLVATLQDTNGTLISNKLISFQLYKIEDNNQTKFMKTYNKKTGNNGTASLQIGLSPGKYEVNCSFGGDVMYNSSEIVAYVTVTGTKTTSTTTQKKDTKTTTSASVKSTTAKKTTDKTQYYSKEGRSPDRLYICSVGLPVKPATLKKYGNKYWKTIFKNKCPKCGKNNLYWGWNWGTYFRDKRREHSKEGSIFCESCGAAFDPISGANLNSTGKPALSIYKAPVNSSKTEAQKLKNGQVVYKTHAQVVKEEAAKNPTRRIIDNSISPYVKKVALNIVGKRTDYQAAKAIATWMKNINYGDYCDFHKNATGVIRSRRGNCCDQTRAMLQLMDAAGVGEFYTMKYVYVCCSGGGVGHVFARLIHKKDGASVYVDPCKNALAWGHHVTGWGRPPGRQTNYPNRPF